jgi:transposase InsO family protein
MELWQMDVVGGVLLSDGREVKVLTGIDDHSRFVVCAGLMVRATSRAVCAHFAEAMRRHGVPQEVLTDNGKVFTGRFGAKDTEVLFDRICRENGIDHLLTAPRRPTTTGKIERFHRTLRQEFLTGRVFGDLATAQAELDTWVASYNTDRPHSALDMATPATRFTPVSGRPADASALLGEGPAMTGSRARSPRTASSRSPGRRSAAASTGPAAASTSICRDRSCRSGMGTS